MLDLFAPLPIEVRHEQRRAYRSFLADRDGVVDVQRRTLTRREEQMKRFETPLPRVRDMDREAFTAQYTRFDARDSKLTPELLFLLAMVKINASEAFGVNASFGDALKRTLANDDDLELRILIEETYHTRILLSSALLYGITVNGPYTPPSALRILIGSIAHTPESISRPLVLASEILGSLMFAEMLALAGQVLKHDPELRDAVEERIVEILVDEIGHISFNRLHLGAAGLAQARLLLPIIAKGLSSAIPEARALGAMPSNPAAKLSCLTTPRGLPEQVRSKTFFA